MRERPKQGLKHSNGICSRRAYSVKGAVQLRHWDLLRNLHLTDTDVWLASSQTSFAMPLFTFHGVILVQELCHYLGSSNLLTVILLNRPVSAQGTVLFALQLQHHCSRLSTDIWQNKFTASESLQGGSNPYLYAPRVAPPKQRRLCWATGWIIVGSKLSVGLGTTVGYNRREEHRLRKIWLSAIENIARPEHMIHTYGLWCVHAQCFFPTQ